MINYTQETDSREFFNFGALIESVPEIERSHETSSTHFSFHSFHHEVTRLFTDARKVIRRLADHEVKDRCSEFLTLIQSLITIFKSSGTDLSNTPPLNAFIPDEGSVLFEWIFNDYRVGISIEPNHIESNWYLVSNENLGNIHASGYLEGHGKIKLLIWLLSFIFSNS